MATYVIRCDHCGFKRWSDGSEESFVDLAAVTLCPTCGGPRRFKCPGCGYVAKAKRWVEPPLPKDNKFYTE